MSHQAVRLGAANNASAATSNGGPAIHRRGTDYAPNDFARNKLSTVILDRRMTAAQTRLSRFSNYRSFDNASDSPPEFTAEPLSRRHKYSLPSVRSDSTEITEENERLVDMAPEHPPAQSGLVVDTFKSDLFLRLNVGGHRFMMRKDTVRHRRVGRLLRLLDHPSPNLFDAYIEHTNEYYFERPPQLFHVIYQFYLTGHIHQPSHLCPMDILDEFDYWQIVPDNILAPCCCVEDKFDEDDVSVSSTEEKPNLFRNLRFGEIRRVIWNIVEEPASSNYAQVFAILSVLFVLFSISGLVLGSLPELQIAVTKKGTEGEYVDMEPWPIIGYVEYMCIVWFTFEYCMKMLVSPERKKTFLQLLNIIDLLAIAPFVIEMLLLVFGVDTDQLRDFKGAFLVIRILRVLRVIRVLKLGRYSSGLQMFGKTLKASFRQLGMMAMVVMTGVIFFSTLVYFLEKDEPNSQFHSIPAACWWCIVTMTTVGYGDLTPVTVMGKLVATGAIACGVLVLALPITIIVDNFMKVAEGERNSGASGVARRFGQQRRPVNQQNGQEKKLSLERTASIKTPLTQNTIC